MNLYPLDPDPGGPLAPAGWTLEVRMNGTGESLYHLADVSRSGSHMCRLSLMGKFNTEDEAQRALVVKARLWIADFLARTSSASSS